MRLLYEDEVASTSGEMFTGNDDSYEATRTFRYLHPSPTTRIVQAFRSSDGAEVECYPSWLGGGIIFNMDSGNRLIDCPFCECEHSSSLVSECEGRYIQEELANYPPELR